MEYKDFNDYELLSYIGEQNEEAGEILYKKYQPLITSIATRMYDPIQNKSSGLELSDLIQEGMVGFSFAIQNYKEENGAMFYTYAKTCIERKIISAIVGAQRLKHKILNESISFNVEGDRKEQIDVDVLLSDNSMNPEILLLSNEDEKELQERLYDQLNDKERQVVELRVSGFSYEEIANLLGSTVKKIDNMIQRIRRKLKK